MATKPKILIVGAGIGGLTAALALLRRGFRVAVYDQAPALSELGAGIQVAANGSRVLRELGLGDALDRIGIVAGQVDLRVWNSDERWRMQDHGTAAARYGSPHYTMHRADLQEMLRRAVEREDAQTIRLGARCIGFDASANRVTLHFENGERIAGDAVIGADGIHSIVRQTLFGADKAEFTGFMAWRGLCPKERLPPALMRHGGWIAPASHIMHYPVRKGAMLNVIAVVERGDWQKESWYDRGTHEEWLADFPGWHDDARAMIASTAEPFKWALMVRMPLPRWSVGNATLLGDACHSTLPFLAQGGSMAIEDAFVLARCLDQFDDIETALKRYETARLERTKRIVLAAVDQKDRLHGDALKQADTAKQHVDEKFGAAAMQRLYDGIYGYDAITVPV
ncbi:MAG TPA: FAD-dependent monooxygenase [Stellaceae bacterium]|nr:FAD-dependent monooxygenase [Stellaceae bacterium]